MASSRSDVTRPASTSAYSEYTIASASASSPNRVSSRSQRNTCLGRVDLTGLRPLPRQSRASLPQGRRSGDRLTGAAGGEVGHAAPDLLGDALLRGLARDLDGVGDGALLRAPVRLDVEVVEAEERRAAVLLPVGDLLDALD